MNSAKRRYDHRDYASSSSSYSSPSRGSASWRYGYDVYLNFRGSDTRRGFIGFLHKTLRDRGIKTFKDSQDLFTGEGIGPDLSSAIHASKIFIIIFSQRYADSKWCLLELAKIAERLQEEGNRGGEIIVMPVFYEMSPSDVRNQTGILQIAFQQHQRSFHTETVEGWKKALRMVSELRGWCIQSDDMHDVVELVDVIGATVRSDLINLNMRSRLAYRETMGFSASRGNTDFGWQTVNRISFTATYEVSRPTRPFLVFISHRGPDTKNSFASLLHEELDNQGLNPFLDKRSIMLGEEIDMVIETAIQECEVGVAIISPDYCTSKNCLHELARLMECNKIVIPIFFDTKVSDLTLKSDASFSRKQLKRFSCALKLIKKWKGIEFNSKDQDWCDMKNSVVAILMNMINRDRKMGFGGLKKLIDYFRKMGIGGLKKLIDFSSPHRLLCKRTRTSYTDVVPYANVNSTQKKQKLIM